MSLDTFRRALEALDEPTSCEGTLKTRAPVAIGLPDGDLGVTDHPGFVDWLLAHAEAAPFGHAGQTMLDPAVRAHLLGARNDRVSDDGARRPLPSSCFDQKAL